MSFETINLAIQNKTFNHNKYPCQFTCFDGLFINSAVCIGMSHPETGNHSIWLTDVERGASDSAEEHRWVENPETPR